MTGAERRGGLWAGWSEDQPRSDYDDVIVRVLEEPEEAPPPPEDRPPAERRPPARGVLAAVFAVVVLAIALDGRDRLTIVEVPSSWGDVPMTCHTTRIEREEGDVEMFRCRAVGGRRLPPGLYRSPESQWTSDITRRDARESRIRISPEGEVEGWAKY